MSIYSGLGPVLSTLQMLADLVLIILYDAIIIILLQMRKLRHREVKSVAQARTANGWWKGALGPTACGAGGSRCLSEWLVGKEEESPM